MRSAVETVCVFVAVRGFETEEQFEEYVKNDPSSGQLLAAVVFDHPFAHDDDPLPLQVKAVKAGMQEVALWCCCGDTKMNQ